jgi:hypothetical protein
LRIPYKVFPDGYGSYTYSVLLNVQIAGMDPVPMRTKKFEAVVDSGATRCLFHADLALAIGFDFKAGKPEMTYGIGGVEESYVHQVRLIVPDGSGKQLTIHAGFKEGLPVAGLLGMNGFFEYYNIAFDPDQKVCDIVRVHHA